MPLISKKPTVVGGVSGGYPAWTPPAGETIEPTAPEKLAGYSPLAYPPNEYFNWFWSLMSLWTNWHAGQSEDTFVISTNTREGDYSTIQLAIAAGISSGDTLLIKTNQTIAAGVTLSIPAGVKLRIKKGVIFTASGVWAPGSVIVSLDSLVSVEGDLVINVTGTGTITKAVRLSGNSIRFENIITNNTNTATIVNDVYIEAGVAAAYGEGETTNTGGGSFTNIITDASTLLTNLVRIREI